jgi:dTDP-4-amino-4,6-dideoxygalactose transaminase
MADEMTPAFPDPIYVTRPLMPPLDDLNRRLAEIWHAQWLTNAGPQHNLLEEALRRHLQVRNISLFNNGTIALLAAIRCLGLTGEVITTPFTFPATAHALSWAGLTPVFGDIDPVRMTLDPAAIPSLITPRTSAILAVHVYGIPCDVAALQNIADQHGLKLIYDAAGAFGTTVDGLGIGNFGDACMFSFHATKMFHTAEGGAIATPLLNTKASLDHLKNFGILNQEEVDCIGINGKMSELQAALGLTVLDCIPDEIQKRGQILERYRENLNNVPGIILMPRLSGVQLSSQYFVVRFDANKFGISRNEVFEALKKHNVFARKYFYPLCTDYACYRDLPCSDPLKVARNVVSEVLCLPLYGSLPLSAVDTICSLVMDRTGVRAAKVHA